MITLAELYAKLAALQDDLAEAKKDVMQRQRVIKLEWLIENQRMLIKSAEMVYGKGAGGETYETN
jgi:hypothetical protein